MKFLNSMHDRGSSKYQTQLDNLNDTVFRLVKSDEPQELHRFFMAYGAIYSNKIDLVILSHAI